MGTACLHHIIAAGTPGLFAGTLVVSPSKMFMQTGGRMFVMTMLAVNIPLFS